MKKAGGRKSRDTLPLRAIGLKFRDRLVNIAVEYLRENKQFR